MRSYAHTHKRSLSVAVVVDTVSMSSPVSIHHQLMKGHNLNRENTINRSVGIIFITVDKFAGDGVAEVIPCLSAVGLAD